MIDVVASAIYNKFLASTEFYDTVGGRMHFEQSPDDVSSPYVVFSIVSITHEEYAGGADDNIRTIELQFDVFNKNADGGSGIAQVVEFLTDTYDWKQIDVEGYHYLKMERQLITPVNYIDEVWQTSVIYELSIVKE